MKKAIEEVWDENGREFKDRIAEAAGVPVSHLPRIFPMEQEDNDSRLKYGLKGLAGGTGLGLATALFSKHGLDRDVNVPVIVLAGGGLGALKNLTTYKGDKKHNGKKIEHKKKEKKSHKR